MDEIHCSSCRQTFVGALTEEGRCPLCGEFPDGCSRSSPESEPPSPMGHDSHRQSTGLGFKKRYVLDALFCLVLPQAVFWTLQAVLNGPSGATQIRLGMITLLKITFICCALYVMLARLLLSRLLPTWFPEKSMERANRLASKGMIDESLFLLQSAYGADDTIADTLDTLRANAYNLLGVYFLEKARNPEKAIHSLEKALSMSSKMSMPKFNLGIAHQRLGNIELARRFLNDFLLAPGKEGNVFVKDAEAALADIASKST